MEDNEWYTYIRVGFLDKGYNYSLSGSTDFLCPKG